MLSTDLLSSFTIEDFKALYDGTDIDPAALDKLAHAAMDVCCNNWAEAANKLDEAYTLLNARSRFAEGYTDYNILQAANEAHDYAYGVIKSDSYRIVNMGDAFTRGLATIAYPKPGKKVFIITTLERLKEIYPNG